MLRPIAILIAIGLLTCRFGQAAAQSPTVPERLTIEQAVTIALANNPAMREAREEVAASRARVAVFKSGYYPQVSFNGIAKLGLSGATNGLGLLGLPASPFWRNLADAGNINQNIFDFGRTRHATAVARAEVDAAQRSLDQVRIEVAEKAKLAFLKALRAQRITRVSEQDVRERQAVERRAREFYEVGLQNSQLALAQARDDEQAAWVELDTALGEPEGARYNLIEPQISLVSSEPLEREIQQALSTRPDLKALKAEIEAQQERVEYARSLRHPLLKGVFSGGYARFAELTPAELMVGGLGLFAPIYTGGGLIAQAQAEWASLEALQARYQSARLAARNEVSLAHTELRKALDSAQADERIAAYAEEALRLAQTRYQAQLVSFVDLLTAETAAESARANYAQAVYDFQIARVRLNAAMGSEP